MAACLETRMRSEFLLQRHASGDVADAGPGRDWLSGYVGRDGAIKTASAGVRSPGFSALRKAVFCRYLGITSGLRAAHRGVGTTNSPESRLLRDSGQKRSTLDSV